MRVYVPVAGFLATLIAVLASLPFLGVPWALVGVLAVLAGGLIWRLGGW